MPTPANASATYKGQIRAIVNGSNVYTVGSNGTYSTIAALVASLSAGTPVDNALAGTTATLISSGSYVTINGVSNFIDTAMLNWPQWITVEDGGAVNTPHLISKEHTGGANTINFYSETDAAASAVNYRLESLPVITIELQDDEIHVINSDLQLPETNIYKFVIKNGGFSEIWIKNGGKLRFPNYGGVIIEGDLLITLGDPDAVMLTNSASTPSAAADSLFVEFNKNVRIRVVPSTAAGGAGGVITSRHIDLKCACFRWRGEAYLLHPNPGTLILIRVTAASIEADVYLSSVQENNNRFLTMEFSSFADRHRGTYGKIIVARSHNIANNIRVGCRDINDDDYSDTPNATAFVVAVIGRATVIFDAVNGLGRAFGGTIAAGMANGASGCTINAAEMEATPSGLDALPCSSVANKVGTQLISAGTSAVVPVANYHHVTLIGSQTITATPAIEQGTIPIGGTLFLYVTDALGTGALTVNDETVSAGSGVITKTGLSSAGVLVINEGEIVEFMYNGDYMIQISDPIAFETLPG